MNPKSIIPELKKFIATHTAECRLPKYGDCGYDHLYTMCESIQNGEVVDEKAHRWLGYIQGVLVANNVATLGQMKDMNHKYSN